MPGPHNKGDPTASISDPDSLPPSNSDRRDPPGLNSSENSRPPEVQPTKVLEMPEGSDMAPQSRGLEEGEMSEYSYEETDVRPHLSEEGHKLAGGPLAWTLWTLSCWGQTGMTWGVTSRGTCSSQRTRSLMWSHSTWRGWMRGMEGGWDLKM